MSASNVDERLTLLNSQGQPREHQQPTAESTFTTTPFIPSSNDGTEQEHLEFSDRLTETQGLMHLLKATIGTGILAMPAALRNAGLGVGLVGIVLIALVTLHCMHLLVGCARSLRRQLGERRLDYEAVAELSVLHGPPALRRFSQLSRHSLNLFLVVNQLGLVAVYFLFVCENVQIFIADVSGTDLSLQLVCTCGLLVFLPYVFLRKLSLLAPLAAVANVGVVVVLIGIVGYCAADLQPLDRLPLVGKLDTLPLFFGIVLFSFESINLVLPIENQLLDRHSMTRTCGLLDTSVLLVIAVYSLVGFYGYLRFGDQVRESITYSLPNRPWYLASIKLAYSFSVFVSYGLQFYLLAHILWQWLEVKVTKCKLLTELSLRTVLVLLSFALPILVPHLDLIIALLGAFSGAAVIFIFPPLLNSLLSWQRRHERRCWRLTLAKNVALCLFGVVALCISTYTTLVQIVQAF